MSRAAAKSALSALALACAMPTFAAEAPLVTMDSLRADDAAIAAEASPFVAQPSSSDAAPPGNGDALVPPPSRVDAADEPVPETQPETSAETPASPPRRRHAKGDPLEGFNRDMFAVHQALDKVVIRPAAMAYGTVVPRPVRSGLRNAFSNLSEPVVFVNDLLQLRPGRAIRTFARFVINSTLGLAGLFDVAKHEELPHHENGFGDTLAYYGIGPGPYLFLPLIGPSTFRDGLGGQSDRMLLPVTVGTPFDTFEYQTSEWAVTGLDQRHQSDADLKALFGSAIDPYATLRSVYLQNRAAEIRGLRARGKAQTLPPEIPEDDLFKDPAATPPAPGETEASQ